MCVCVCVHACVYTGPSYLRLTMFSFLVLCLVYGLCVPVQKNHPIKEYVTIITSTLTVLQALSLSERILMASIMRSPAMTALVVAMAGMMLPAMASNTQVLTMIKTIYKYRSMCNVLGFCLLSISEVKMRHTENYKFMLQLLVLPSSILNHRVGAL